MKSRPNLLPDVIALLIPGIYALAFLSKKFQRAYVASSASGSQPLSMPDPRLQLVPFSLLHRVCPFQRVLL